MTEQRKPKMTDEGSNSDEDVIEIDDMYSTSISTNFDGKRR